MKCSNCGAENSDNFKFCVKCGAPLEVLQITDPEQRPRLKVCPKCGQTYEDNIKFCMKDGTPLDSQGISSVSVEGKTVKSVKSSKNLIFIVIIGVLFVIAGVSGYLLYPKIIGKKQEPTIVKEENIKLPESTSEKKEEQKEEKKPIEETPKSAKVETKEERKKHEQRQETVQPTAKTDPLRLEEDINRALKNANIKNVFAIVNENLEVTLKGTVSSNKEKERVFEVVRNFKVQRIKDSIFIVE